ncbi:peptidoglycan recognition protein family protein [Ottowia cancrivicina]|uniref:N-acetylmuramoyl-L-alanine amidase n=1 Tax=Ottowia cancrivicina TaxID=3040346 RepID=A0AAW6RPE8_9BURK|nr:peptidoglycan recognition family protein [Ottowia sp. 10c7w1]MDG9700541.1 N-acetylmuramoyl-L-alanine amidase [Ottowia sp. 10c7w1]
MNGISSTASRSSLQSLPDAPQPQPTGAASPQPASSPSTPGNSQTLTRMARDARPPLAGQQQAAVANAKGAATGASQLNIDDKGHVQHERVLLKTAAGRETISPKIERKEMPEVNGLVIHQTDSPTVSSTLNNYAKDNAYGAHFLIDKDGTIYQTASLNKTCNHVGTLKSRCAHEQTCSPGETKLNHKFNAKAENKREIVKQAGVRYPSNKDSIGIELVGDSFPKGPNIDQKKVKFEIVTDAQNESLRWLIEQLKKEYRIPDSEVFRHPEISYKNITEASTAKW